ncbi:MAG: methylmalonyl-CoA epimerase [Actinobacteria bacterium]|nr:methylmalonyl-CoA epimerase [Actinomycetota bacterium]MCL6105596.1 methylmalonyl-CoA epimerase [Actinomycetota bacterium]
MGLILPGVLGIDHIGIAVVDLDSAVKWHEEVLGLKTVHVQEIKSDSVKEVLMQVGDCNGIRNNIQLLSPTNQDSPVGRFLSKHGEGIHHIGYRVADCAQALRHCVTMGVDLIDTEPRLGSAGATVAFIHPKGAFGTLIELVEKVETLSTANGH